MELLAHGVDQGIGVMLDDPKQVDHFTGAVIDDFRVRHFAAAKEHTSHTHERFAVADMFNLLNALDNHLGHVALAAYPGGEAAQGFDLPVFLRCAVFWISHC